MKIFAAVALLTTLPLHAQDAGKHAISADAAKTAIGAWTGSIARPAVLPNSFDSDAVVIGALTKTANCAYIRFAFGVDPGGNPILVPMATAADGSILAYGMDKDQATAAIQAWKAAPWKPVAAPNHLSWEVGAVRWLLSFKGVVKVRSSFALESGTIQLVHQTLDASGNTIPDAQINAGSPCPPFC